MTCSHRRRGQDKTVLGEPATMWTSNNTMCQISFSSDYNIWGFRTTPDVRILETNSPHWWQSLAWCLWYLQVFGPDVLHVNDAMSNCNTVVFPGKYSTRNCFTNVTYYFCCLGATQHTYQFNMKNGQTVTEDVIADVKDNYVQYHLEDKGSEVWVINDFNRVSTHALHTVDYKFVNIGLRRYLW